MKNKPIIIISNTLRSIEYLKELKLKKIIPELIIYLNDGIKNKFATILVKQKFFFSCMVKEFLSNKINHKIAKYILNQKSNIIIFSGYPGYIIKNKLLLSKKKFLHSHPGKLPNYKGSTTIYYSLLKEGKIFCSTFVFNLKLDSGQNILTKNYKIPRNIFEIDGEYDSKIRAINMVEALTKLKSKRKGNGLKRKIKNKNKNKSNLYFVIHPMLRSIVFKKKKFYK